MKTQWTSGCNTTDGSKIDCFCCWVRSGPIGSGYKGPYLYVDI